MPHATTFTLPEPERAARLPPVSERVILLDDDGRATGTAPKAEVHHGATPLHLAFSCYVFDAADELLVTRRSAAKRTFPGVWTNSFCGHPVPGERMTDAVHRRARQELGIDLDALRLVLPGFRYRAEQDGLVENEMCPVFCAWGRIADATPDPFEVDEVRGVAWSSFSAAVRAGSWPGVSPWCREQVDALHALGADPSGWPTGDERGLPAAATV